MVNPVIYTLFAFVALGLASKRLGTYTYYLMGAVIVVYLVYAYRQG